MSVFLCNTLQNYIVTEIFVEDGNYKTAGYREAANCRYCIYSMAKDQHFSPCRKTMH